MTGWKSPTPMSRPPLRRAPDEVVLALERAADAKDRGLVERSPQDLQPHRELRTREATGDAHARDARQVAGDGEDVEQVHRQRVVHLLANLERGHGRCRRDDGVDTLESGLEVVPDER